MNLIAENLKTINILKEALNDITGIENIDISDKLSDVGWDSIVILQLVSKLCDELKIKLEIKSVVGLDTVFDLVNLINIYLIKNNIAIFICEITGCTVDSSDDNLISLGWDSISVLQFAAKLKEYTSLDIKISSLINLNTVKHLNEYVLNVINLGKELRYA